MSCRQSVIEPGFYRLESSELIFTYISKVRRRRSTRRRSTLICMPRSVMRKGQLIEVCGVDKNSKLLVKCYSSYTLVFNTNGWGYWGYWSTKENNEEPYLDTTYRETIVLLDEKQERQLSLIISKGDRERELDATYDIGISGMRSDDIKRWLDDPGINNVSRKIALGSVLASIHALLLALELMLLLLIIGQLNVTGDIAGIIQEVEVVIWNRMLSLPVGKTIAIGVAAEAALVILERILKRAFERAFYSDINDATFYSGHNLVYKYHHAGPDDKIIKYIEEACAEERCYDINYVFMYTMRA